MRIVRLGDHEGARLKAIRLEALRDAPEAFGTTHAESVGRPDEVWARQVAELATFVAVVEGTDVGMVRCVTSKLDPTTALLISMWVAPTVRGRGVGEALVDAVIGWARSEGHRQVELQVRDANQPAIELYERLGFVHAGPVDSVVPEHRRLRRLG